MDGFQTTILGVAAVILILILTVVGLIMSNNIANSVFPPSSLKCPNYWQLNSDGTCQIPINTTGASATVGVNKGTWDGSTVNGSKTMPGLNSTLGTINFADAGWGSLGSASATCAQQSWANKYGILWDGISNYNGCK